MRDLSADLSALRCQARTVYIVLAALTVVCALATAAAARQILTVDEMHDEASRARGDLASLTGGPSDAFRMFRESLEQGEHFAVVFGDHVDPGDRGMFWLVALAYLYPGIAVESPRDADAVMVFGEPPATVRDSFDEVAVVGDVWMGRSSRD